MNKRVSLLFIFSFILVLAYSFFFFIPKYEDKKRNSVGSNSATKNQTAIDLHESLFIADLHADSLLWDRNLNKEYHYGHVDLPRLQTGNIGLQVFSVVTKTPRQLNYYKNDDQTDNITLLAIAQRWPAKTWKSTLHRALYQADKLAKLENDNFTIIRTKQDLKILLENRKINKSHLSGLLSLEGAHALEGDLNNVDRLFHKGFRIFGFTHFFDNELGGSAHGIHKQGISTFGLEVLKRMENLGILVDISHASPRLIDDIFEHATRPVIASHTGIKAICDTSPRNLNDQQIKQVAQSGGLIGIGFWPAASCSRDVSGIIKSIQYVVDLVGINYIALGSDFDGNVHTPFDAANINIITAALIENNFSSSEIHKIMGENVINLLLRTLP